MILYTEDRFILKLLLQNKKINIYHLYQDTNYSVGQIARFLKTYTSKFYIVKWGDTIYLTHYGRFKLKNVNFATTVDDRYWRTIPKELKQPTIDINDTSIDIKIKIRQVRGINSKKGM